MSEKKDMLAAVAAGRVTYGQPNEHRMAVFYTDGGSLVNHWALAELSDSRLIAVSTCLPGQPVRWKVELTELGESLARGLADADQGKVATVDLSPEEEREVTRNASIPSKHDRFDPEPRYT